MKFYFDLQSLLRFLIFPRIQFFFTATLEVTLLISSSIYWFISSRFIFCHLIFPVDRRNSSFHCILCYENFLSSSPDSFYGFDFVKSLEFFRMSSLNREIEVNSTQTTEQNNLQAEEQSG